MLDLDEPSTTPQTRRPSSVTRSHRTATATSDLMMATATGRRPVATDVAQSQLPKDSLLASGDHATTGKAKTPTSTTSAASSSTVPRGTDTDITTRKGDMEPSESGSILSRGVASSHLQWWQLLCIILTGVLALGVGGYLLWRRRKRSAHDRSRREHAEREEKEAKLAPRSAAPPTKEKSCVKSRPSLRWSDEEDSDFYSDYDSLSDGGTIRPRRRYKARRHYPAPHRSRGRGAYSPRRDRSYDDYSLSSSRSEYSPAYRPSRSHQTRHRDRHHKRFPHSPQSTAASVTSKRSDFRDSVFSTYSSMRSAAVRLKRHEAEVKLAKQLEAEEEAETRRLAARKLKAQEANAEIEKERIQELVAIELEKERIKRTPSSTLSSSQREHLRLPYVHDLS